MGQFRRNLLFSLISGKKDSNYLTIEALEDGLTVSFNRSGLSYSIDGGDWVKINENKYTPSINKGHSIAFKGKRASTESKIGIFTITNKCSLSGNCMSIIYGDDAEGQISVPDYGLRNLFSGCDNIVSVSKGFLPATELGKNCYSNMFRGCLSLVQASELPAKTLAEYCYYSMFSGCTSLTNAPKMAPTELGESCCVYMFNDCTSLTTAPELPATVLAYNCYSSMFSGCTSLVNAPELPATVLRNGCYTDMFHGCNKLNYIKAMFTDAPSQTYTSNWVRDVSPTGTFVKNKDATWDYVGFYGIPEGWEVVTE